MAFNLPEACGRASPICPMRMRSLLMGCAFSGKPARDVEVVAIKWRRFMSVLLILDGVIIKGKLEKNFLSSFLVLIWFKIGLYETGRSYSRSH